MEAAAQNPPPVLEMKDLLLAENCGAPGTQIEAVDWRVEGGDFWVIGGLHWSGKSGLLATAAGLAQPQRGGHFLFGSDVGDMDEETLLRHRLRLGFVFEQGGRLFNGMTVIENICLPLRYHRRGGEREILERAGALIEWMELGNRAANTPGMLSRGWRLRAALARALALRPEVLFLDDPLAGLDPRQRQWWQHFLLEVSNGHSHFGGRPLTLVATAQDLRPWRSLGQQFALISDGRFRTLGGPDTLEDCRTREPVLEMLLSSEPANA